MGPNFLIFSYSFTPPAVTSERRSTVQYSTVQYCTVHYNTVQYILERACKGRLPLVHRGLEWPQFLNSLLVCFSVCLQILSLFIVQYCTVQYCTVHYSTIQYILERARKGRLPLVYLLFKNTIIIQHKFVRSYNKICITITDRHVRLPHLVNLRFHGIIVRGHI